MTSHGRCHCDGFHYLLDLPRELRDKIYYFATTDLPTRVIINNRSSISELTLVPEALPKLCFTNKQLYDEVIPIFIKRTRFIFTTPKIQQMRLFDWFISGFEKGIESIRMLSVYDIKGYATLDVAKAFYPETLVSRCTGLRSLILEGSAKSLICYFRGVPEGESPGARLSTKDELQHLWGYTSLSQLKKLEYFNIRFIVSLRDLRKLGFEHAEDVVKNVRAILEEEFEERRSKMTLIVEAELEDHWYTYGVGGP